MKPALASVAALAAFTLGVAHPLAAGAQGAATIRGVVYACGLNAPIAGARVRVRGLDTARSIDLVSDARGRFSHVGLEPGRYLITASNDRPYRHFSVASRLARLESDDVLGMRIGTHLARGAALSATGPDRRGVAYQQAAPVCDEPTVPPAPSTTDRTIIH